MSMKMVVVSLGMAIGSGSAWAAFVQADAGQGAAIENLTRATERLAVAVEGLVAESKTAQTRKSEDHPNHLEAGFGFYPIRIYDLDPQAGTFAADFYFWTELPGLQPLPGGDFEGASLDTSNGEALQCQSIFYQPTKASPTFWYRCRSRFYHSFDFKEYPYDEHKLAVRIEVADRPESEFRFVLKELSNYSQLSDGGAQLHLGSVGTVMVDGWDLKAVNVGTSSHDYKTDWGFKDDTSASVYSSATMYITVARKPAEPMALLLTTNLCLVLLGFAVYRVRFSDQGTRLTSAFAILGAAGANHYGYITTGPASSGSLRYSDLLFLAVYLWLSVIVALVFANRGRFRDADVVELIPEAPIAAVKKKKSVGEPTEVAETLLPKQEPPADDAKAQGASAEAPPTDLSVDQASKPEKGD